MATPIVLRVQKLGSRVQITGVPAPSVQAAICEKFRDWKGPQKFADIEARIRSALEPAMNERTHVENETGLEWIQVDNADVVAQE